MLTLNEDLFDDVVEIEIPDVEIQPPLESPDIELAGPDPGQATGEASLILNAISDCAKTIDNYNMMKANLSSSEAGNIIDEIANEETVILGKLQALLKQVSPNAECIPDAIEGAEEVLGESINESYAENKLLNLLKTVKKIDREKDNIQLWITPKGNYQVTLNGKDLVTIGGNQFSEDDIDELRDEGYFYDYNQYKLNNESLRAKRNKKTSDESLNESKKNKLKKEIFDYLDDCGGYTDYNQKVEDVMDEWNLDRDTAEGYVWDWSLEYENNFDESLNEAVGTSIKAKDLLPGHTYGDKNGTFKVVSISSKGLREYPVKVEVIANGNEDTLYLKPEWKFYEIVENNESLKEDIVLYSGSWKDEDGNWQPSTLQYKGFRLKVTKDNLISIYDKHGELVDYGFKTKKSAIDAIDSGKYDGLNESKLDEGDWEDPEWRKYYGVDDDSFYDEPIPQPMDIDDYDYDIDDTFEESFKETSKFLDPITHKLKVEAWEPVEQSQEEPNKIDDQIPDDMEVDDEF